MTLCYPNDGDTSTAEGVVGTPVTVRLDAPFTFRAIMRLGQIDLSASATMRIENDQPTAHLPTPPLPC